MVKRLFIQDLRQIILYLLVVLIIFHMCADIIHHFHDHQICSAMPGSLQRTECRCNRRICIWTWRRDDTRRKCGIVSAAMLHMQDQCNLKHFRFQMVELFVRTQHSQEIFSGGKWRIRAVNVHASIFVIMVVCVISIYRQHRKNADQHHTLAQYIVQLKNRSILIIRCKRQHTFRHGIHDVGTRRFHDNVTHKIRRKVSA